MLPSMRIKVLIIGLDWPPTTFIGRLIKGLCDAGVEVTIASARRPDRDWLSRPCFHWLHAPPWKGFLLKRMWRLGKLLVKACVVAPADLRRLAKVTQGNSLGIRLNIWLRLLPLAGKSWDLVYLPWVSTADEYVPFLDPDLPVVISCRGSQVNIAPHDPPRAEGIVANLELAFRRATAIHCVSEAMKTEAIQFGLDPGKAWVIVPAVDPEFFQPQPQPTRPGPFQLVTTGSLRWVKGYEYALVAIRRLLDAGILVDYHLIGDGPERQRLLFTINDLELEGRVSLHGRQPSQEVKRLLQQADAFLLSSLSEGISNAALEAMACGLPVVTTDCGGMREVVSDGVEGYVVPVRDPEAMAAAVARLAADREKCRRLGQAARERVLRQFNLKQQVEQFTSMFRSILIGEPVPQGLGAKKAEGDRLASV